MSEIETRLFRYFVAVAQEQHFSRAALRLRISPPTLTHQIKKLEDQVGVRLVERNGNTRVALTEAGRRFFERAQHVLRDIEEAKMIARRTGRGEIGQIDVGFMPSAACSGLVQRWLGKFQRDNPTIEINMHRRVPMAQIRAILSKELDVGFSARPHRYPAGVEGFEIHRQPMVLALPRNHPLARGRKISPAMLQDEVFIGTGPDREIAFTGHTDILAGVGNFKPGVIKRDDDLITVLTYVSMGCGVAVIPQSVSRINIPDVVFKDLATKTPASSSTAFVYRCDDPSPAVNLLIKFMRSTAAIAGNSAGALSVVSGREHRA